MPIGQGGVLPVAQAAAVGRIRVRPRFDGPPVVPGGDTDGVDAVHDAFVVGRGPIGINDGEGVGFFDPAGHFAAVHPLGSKRISRNGAASRGRPLIGQVGEDAQIGAAAG